MQHLDKRRALIKIGVSPYYLDERPDMEDVVKSMAYDFIDEPETEALRDAQERHADVLRRIAQVSEYTAQQCEAEAVAEHKAAARDVDAFEHKRVQAIQLYGHVLDQLFAWDPRGFPKLLQMRYLLITRIQLARQEQEMEVNPYNIPPIVSGEEWRQRTLTQLNHERDLLERVDLPRLTQQVEQSETMLRHLYASLEK